jgi:hypothetical protein
MRSTRMHRVWYVMIFAALLAGPLIAGAQQCNRRAVVGPAAGCKGGSLLTREPPVFDKRSYAMES